MSAGLTSPPDLRVLVVVSEMAPFAKTGGLADVAGALPEALARLGCRVRVCLPCYPGVRDRAEDLRAVARGLRIPTGAATLEADVLETRTAGGVPVNLVEREDMFNRPNLYRGAKGDYYDNLERFSFFSRAALYAAGALDFVPNVVHCHDWQTGLVPPVLASFFPDAVSVFTIHNLGYQGLFPAERLRATGLDTTRFFHPEGIEFWGNLSLLKAGIVYADAVTTVSPTYAREIQTPEQGMGMEGVLLRRSEDLFGILNGMDESRWNPETDPHLPARYSAEDMAGKAECKRALIRETELEQALELRPLIGMVSRLDHQKGIDLLVEALEPLAALGTGLVVLGTGDRALEDRLRAAARSHRGRVAVRIGFDEALAHRITAGADVFLVPSRYEPCGLTQLHAMRYGTVPVVRSTGGLKDTVEAYDPESGRGTGFEFREADPQALLRAAEQAVLLFHRSERWSALQRAAMVPRFSWDVSAGQYLTLYQDRLRRRERGLDKGRGTG